MAKNFIFEVDDMAEGVYMASGAAGDGDCFIVKHNRVQNQSPKKYGADYRVHFDAHHQAGDKHKSATQRLTITFNLPVQYVMCDAPGGVLVTGDGTNTLVLDLAFDLNHHEDMNFDHLYVNADPGLAVTNVTVVDTGKVY